MTSSFTPEQRAELDALVAARVSELRRDLQRTLAASVLQQAIRVARVEQVPCIVQSIGLVVGGVNVPTYAMVVPDDNQTGAVAAFRVGTALAAGDRGLLVFFGRGAPYVFGPIPQ